MPKLTELQLTHSDCIRFLFERNVSLPGVKALGLNRGHREMVIWISNVFPDLEILSIPISRSVLEYRVYDDFQRLNGLHLKTLRYDLLPSYGEEDELGRWSEDDVNRKQRRLYRSLPTNTNVNTHDSSVPCCPQHRAPPDPRSIRPNKRLGELMPGSEPANNQQ